MKRMARRFLALVVALFAGLFLGVTTVQAAPVGMHVLRPEEFENVEAAFRPVRKENEPLYITVPFTLADLQRLPQWQKSFAFAREKNIVPLVRLATHVEGESWAVPSQKDIVDLANGLKKLNWPQQQRYVILFNEPNHAKEWGGRVDPHDFAEKTNFALDWFGTEMAEYVLLPAALDLAASDTKITKEAFSYWREVLGSKPEILEKIAAWNSHSYPNPGFSSAPTQKGKNRLDGFRHELAFLKSYTDREFEVYITETGWERNASLDKRLSSYYRQALTTVWSDEKIKAVTPFVFAGSPGPFSNFSFIDERGKPTVQWQAIVTALAQQRLLTDRSTSGN